MIEAGPVCVIARSRSVSREADFVRVFPDHDEAIRVGIRQGADEQGIDGGEDGGVSADAERERQDGNGREPGGLFQQTEAIADVTHRAFDGLARESVGLFLESSLPVEDTATSSSLLTSYFRLSRIRRAFC